MYDPFVQSDPPVLVHELDGRQFEAIWNQAADAEQSVDCPLCAAHGVAQHGIAPHSRRPWIRFVCGDVVSQEITAG